MDIIPQNKCCLIYNYAQHYRTNIFTLIDREMHFDFVFGDTMADVKKMDYTLLTNLKKEVKNITFICEPFYYQKGVLTLLNDDYSSYLMLGEIYCLSTWLMLFASNFQKKKKIYLWTHGWYGRESAIKKLIKKIYFKMSDGIFLYGDYAKQLMIKEGIKQEKLHVIYNSLAYDEQIILRNKLKSNSIYQDHFKNNNRNLIFIGRLTSVKRLDLLLNAIALLKTHDDNYNLTLIGTGEMKLELEDQVYKLGLENIWFFGACYDECKISELIYNADLCVSPGNVGLTAIHSMTYGTPVITHNNYPYQMPEFEAIENHYTGTFFEYENYSSLAEGIQRWFKLDLNRETIRNNCHEVIDSKYNPHIQIEILKNYIN